MSAKAVVIPLRPASRDSGGDRTDAELVEAARRGSRPAFERLYRRHSRMAFGMAHRLLAGHEVDDTVQDAFVTAWEQLEKLDEPQAFARWLGTIVVNKSRRRLRRRALRNRLLPGHQEDVDQDQIIGTHTDPEARAELHTLYEVLDRMSTDARLAIVLRRVEGMTIPEVAAAMDCSPATVKRRLRDAEEALAKHTDGGKG